jgi:hypothetical protein
MRISHENKWIFFATPRSGSTTATAALDKYSDIASVNISERKKYNNPFYRHMTAKEAQEIFIQKKWQFDEYFKFAGVRNPWDRAVSLYQHAVQILRMRVPAFKTWALELEPQNRNPLMFDGVLNRYSDENNQYCLQYIIRFENLQEDFNVACDKIGIPQQSLPHHNKTKHKHYTEYYDDETRQIVAKKYAKDIEYFGYKFGE